MPASPLHFRMRQAVVFFAGGEDYSLAWPVGVVRAGVEIEQPSESSKAIRKMQDLNLVALDRAFSAVQSNPETFAVETSYRGKAFTKVEVVASSKKAIIARAAALTPWSLSY